MEKVKTKCTHCGEWLDEEEGKIKEQDKHLSGILELFSQHEYEQESKRIVLQFIKLEVLAMILYFTADKQWPWWGVFMCIALVFTLFRNVFVCWLYILSLSFALGYIIFNSLVQWEHGKWWCAALVFIFTFFIHSAALIKDRKLFN